MTQAVHDQVLVAEFQGPFGLRRKSLSEEGVEEGLVVIMVVDCFRDSATEEPRPYSARVKSAETATATLIHVVDQTK